MDRNLALEMVRVTEAAALSSARWMGIGNEKAAHQAAADAMRRAFDAVGFAGSVVLGEGERGNAPVLFTGERLGGGEGPALDLVVQALEGPQILAEGRPSALAAVAATSPGGFLRVPDTTVEKIAAGAEAKGAVDLRLPPAENLQRIADARRCYVEDLTVAILNRPRHAELIRAVRESGARIKLIQDGDVSAAMATGFPHTGLDVLMGSGGAAEAILAAAALQCLGGELQARFTPRDDQEVEQARRLGIKDLERVYTIDDLAAGELLFAATGVTDGDVLQGVRFFGGGARTHSLALRRRSGTTRFIEASHRFDRQPEY